LDAEAGVAGGGQVGRWAVGSRQWGTATPRAMDGPLPWREGSPLPAPSPAGAGRVRGQFRSEPAGLRGRGQPREDGCKKRVDKAPWRH
jgi:hypothetical protein